jgi:hypothetical protein
MSLTVTGFGSFARSSARLATECKYFRARASFDVKIDIVSCVRESRFPFGYAVGGVKIEMNVESARGGALFASLPDLLNRGAGHCLRGLQFWNQIHKQAPESLGFGLLCQAEVIIHRSNSRNHSLGFLYRGSSHSQQQILIFDRSHAEGTGPWRI